MAAVVATNQPAAISNLVEQTTGVAIKVPAKKTVETTNPVDVEYEKLLEQDDAAKEEVDKWIQDEEKFAEKGASISKITLNARIRERYDKVRKAYEDFLLRHPEHVDARIAYGSFLGDMGEEEEGAKQWEKARQQDPTNPSPWNNLANYYGHRSPVKKAFEYYAKAIELNPKESVYYHNFGTTVYLFRKDAMEYYNIKESEVFDRALELYRKAQELDPENFVLAHDIAQTYYGIKPARTEAALKAWNYALKIAKDDVQREGVYLHLARFEMNSGHFEIAHGYLNSVTNNVYRDLKARLVGNLAQKEKGIPATAETPESKPTPKPEAVEPKK